MEHIENIGYDSLEKEYPAKYRNNHRSLVRSQKLADVLYERIKYVI